MLPRLASSGSTPHFARRFVLPLLLIATACATPVPRQGPVVDPGSQSSSSRTEPDARADPSKVFRDELEAAESGAARLEATERALEAARLENRADEAAGWLLGAIEAERDADTRAALETRFIELIDGSISPIALRSMLEDAEQGRFPHEDLLFKLALIQLHAGDLTGGQDALDRYLEDYPEGRYASRAMDRRQRLLARAQVNPDTLGVLLPLSGPKGAYGRLARQALELAFQGSAVRVVVRDTRDDEATTAAAVESLVVDEGVIAVLGPVFRRESRAAAVVANRFGVPLLTISAAEDVANLGPWVFRNGVTNRIQAKALVAHAMDVLGLRTFAILHPRHPYGEELRDLFWDEVVARGGEIRGVEAYAVDATTFSRPVKRLVGSHRPERREDYLTAVRECQEEPDSYRRARCREKVRKNLKPLIDFEGLFIPDYARSIRMIAAALAAADIIVEKDPRRLRVIERTLGRTPKVVTLLGASGWNSDKLTDSTGRTVENAVFTDGFFARSEDERTSRFVRGYQERFARVPSLYPEALVFDSARILRRVVEQQAPTTRMGMREALQGVVDFPGVTGVTTFAGSQEASKTLKILTITDGEIVEAQGADEGGRSRSARRTNALP